MPGLVDAHTHTFLQPGDYDVQLLKQSLPRRTLQAAAQARALLLARFTTIRDLATEGAMYGDADLRDAIADGIVRGPRMQVATPRPGRPCAPESAPSSTGCSLTRRPSR